MHPNLQTNCSVKDFYGTAWDRAVKLNEKLPEEGPSFVKLMLKSHVVRGFWLVSLCLLGV
jgi:hypothetical protein